MSQQQQPFGFNSDFSAGFSDFGNEFCDIQELRPPKVETSRTPPVEIDLDSEPDQEAVSSRETSVKGQERPLQGNEGDEEDEEDDEDDEGEDEEEAGSSNVGNVAHVKSSTEGTAGEVDDESGSDSGSEDSDGEQEQSEQIRLP